MWKPIKTKAKIESILKNEKNKIIKINLLQFGFSLIHNSIAIIEKQIIENKLCSTVVDKYKVPGKVNRDITIIKLKNGFNFFLSLKK